MLPGLMLAAAATAMFPAQGTYRYTASLNGQSVGQWAVNVKRDGIGTEIDESSAASIGGMEASATATLMLGPDLSPTQYNGNYRMAGQTPTVTVALTPASATVVSSEIVGPRTLALGANTKHFVVIEPGLLAGLFALPAQLQTWREPAVTWISPITAQVQPLPAGSAAPGTPPSDVPAQDTEVSMGGQIPFTVWYDPGTMVPDKVIVPAQNAVLTRVR